MQKKEPEGFGLCSTRLDFSGVTRRGKGNPRCLLTHSMSPKYCGAYLLASVILVVPGRSRAERPALPK